MENKKKKRMIKKIIAWVLVLGVVAALVLLPFLAENASGKGSGGPAILSGTAERRDIAVGLSGTGTLTEESGVEVTVPAGVEITGYLVKNGDLVAEGDDIATVDKATVLLAIQGVQETIDHISKEMESAANAKAGSGVNAPTAARVMHVYAQKGDTVLQVMQDNGALAVLSLDGLMAVELEVGTPAPVQMGDAVQVTLADGTAEAGRVESCVNGTAVITLSDAKSRDGDTVSVAAEDGTELGEGALYIHSEWKATGYAGTISAVNCSEGQKVYRGASLFRFSDTTVSAEYDRLLQDRRDYEDLLAELFGLYENGTVKAPNAGAIDGVDEELVKEIPAGGSRTVVRQSIAHVTGLKAIGAVRWDDDPVPTPPPDTPPGGDPEEPKPVKAWITSASMAGGVTYVTASGSVGTLSPMDMMALPMDKLALLVQDTIVILTFDAEGKLVDIGSGGAGGGMEMPDFSKYMGMFGQATATTEEFEYYSLEGTAVASVIPQELFTVTVPVDELDILSVYKGQEVQITVDALPGRSLAGTVTGIDIVGSNNGGTSKFNVEVTLEHSDDMLAGMNASVLIPVSVKENVLTVPAEALVEEGTRTVVYLGYDEKEEALINPVEVQTGVSDGLFTEILSGLAEGQDYTYAYYDQLHVEGLSPAAAPAGTPGN